MKLKLNKSQKAGFSLIELITVLAILAILVGLTLPAYLWMANVGKETSGLNNIKTITAATLLFAADNNGRAPAAVTNHGYVYFYTELSAFMNNDGNGTTWDPVHEAFKDPSAPINKGQNHFTMNNNIGSTNVPLIIFEKPSQTVLYFDGAQIYDGNVEAAGWTVDNSNLNWVRESWGSWTNPHQAVAKGPNDDTSATGGNIRWRNRGDTAAKFSFLDGHVELLKPEQVKRGFFMLP